MAKFIKVTDSSTNVPQVGYHDVDDDFVLPPTSNYTTFEFVDEDEARENHPALFAGEDDGEFIPKAAAKIESE